MSKDGEQPQAAEGTDGTVERYALLGRYPCSTSSNGQRRRALVGSHRACSSRVNGASSPLSFEKRDAMAYVKKKSKYLDAKRSGGFFSNMRTLGTVHGERFCATVYGAW